jgi:hypothetical protein
VSPEPTLSSTERRGHHPTIRTPFWCPSAILHLATTGGTLDHQPATKERRRRQKKGRRKKGGGPEPARASMESLKRRMPPQLTTPTSRIFLHCPNSPRLCLVTTPLAYLPCHHGEHPRTSSYRYRVLAINAIAFSPLGEAKAIPLGSTPCHAPRHIHDEDLALPCCWCSRTPMP